MKPKLIPGGVFNDARGELRFVNDFDLTGLRRAYVIRHPSTDVVRAWQAHSIESKHFFPLRGRFIVAWVAVDDFRDPSPTLVPEWTEVSSVEPKVVSIPKGYANGLRALEPNSELMVFSDLDLEHSVAEKIVFPAHRWLDWNQFTPQ